MSTKNSSTKQMPILKAQRIVRRYLRYGVVMHDLREPEQVRQHAEKQLTRIDGSLNAALRRIG